MTTTPAAVGPAGQDIPSATGRHDWTARGIEWASGATAVAMFAYGVALSYSVLFTIARAAGLPHGLPTCGRWASRRSWPLPR